MPNMTTNEISDNLRNKSFHNPLIAFRKLIGVDQLNLETWWTDHIQSLIDFGNRRYLGSFSLRLEMEVNEDECGYNNCHVGGF
jgi:hypothetical protein